VELSEVPPVAGVTHRYVNAGGVTLHVAEAGEGPPLLLLHGWPQHWWCWRHLIPRLAPQYRILAPDLRGWGFSDAPPGDYAKATLAADIVALLDAMIAIRFFMKLLGASYSADFVRFMYGITAPLVGPFRGIFPASGSGSYVLEPESLIAIAIYLLIGWGVVALIRIMRAPRTRPVV